MRWLITGAGGCLGTELVRVLASRAEPALSLTRQELDVTDAARVSTVIEEWFGASRDHNVLVNAAAFTNVDRAESDPDAGCASEAVNTTAPGYLAGACARTGVQIVHVSTNYVFDGARTDGRGYEPDDATGPLNRYARSKIDGERQVRINAPDGHCIVRTGWLYGDVGTNFVRTIARLAAERDTLHVVDDQHGQPTWAATLAGAIVALASAGRAEGTLHVTDSGQTTFCGFARAVFREIGADPARVRAATSSEVVRPARRPAWAVLSDSSYRVTGLPPLPPWEKSLRTAVARHPDLVAPSAPVRGSTG